MSLLSERYSKASTPVNELRQIGSETFFSEPETQLPIILPKCNCKQGVFDMTCLCYHPLSRFAATTCKNMQLSLKLVNWGPSPAVVDAQGHTSGSSNVRHSRQLIGSKESHA